MTVPINSEVAPIGPQALADLLGRWPAADGPLYRLLATRIGRLAETRELPPEAAPNHARRRAPRERILLRDARRHRRHRPDQGSGRVRARRRGGPAIPPRRPRRPGAFPAHRRRRLPPV